MSITARGGYQLIDCNGATINMTASILSIEVKGIYEQAKNYINKPAYFGNLNIIYEGGTPYIPMQSVFLKTNTSNDDLKVDVVDNESQEWTFFIAPNDTITSD